MWSSPSSARSGPQRAGPSVKPATLSRDRVKRDPEIVVGEDPQVYRPAEDSLLLLDAISLDPHERFLEVGTGTGLIALHAARARPAVATDANVEAVQLARRNARRNELPLHVIRTHLMAGLRGPFDVVAFNPPYLEGPPRDSLDRAWQGGHQGSEVSQSFLADLGRVLSAEGRAYLLLSRANEATRRSAEERFRVRVVSAKRLFFEELEVLEVTRRGP